MTSLTSSNNSSSMLCPPQQSRGELAKALLANSKSHSGRKIGGEHADGTGAPRGVATLLERQKQVLEKGKCTSGPQLSQQTKVPTVTVVNRRVHKPIKEDAASTNITRIVRAVRSIYHSPTGDAGCSYQDIYLATEHAVVSAHMGGELYGRVKMEMDRAVGEVARSLRASTSNATYQQDGTGDASSQMTWLTQLAQAWTTWCEKTTLVCDVLTLLDCVYVLNNSELPSLKSLGLDLFKQAIANESELRPMALACVHAATNATRLGSSLGYQSLHRKLVAMWTTVGIYETAESSMLEATSAHYAAQARSTIASMDTASYLLQARTLLQKELEIGEWLYANSLGQQKGEHAARVELIQANTKALVDGLPLLLRDAALPSLVLLYSYLSGLKELGQLRASFSKYITEHGESITTDKNNDDKMVERLLEYKGVIDNIVVTAFQNDGDFRQTQKESFERFINKRENKTAELIAKFLDARLRSGNKTMSDQEMEHVLNETLVIFRYCHAKDMFEEFYKRLFAKRLLLNRSASSDAEQSMLLKLKEECGPAFTQKLETMLTDISLSDEMMKGFIAMCEGDTNLKDDFDLTVNVLTQAHWPTYPQTHINIPPEMAAATERFSNFYETRNQGRKLHWAHTLGTTSMTAQFGKAGEKELLVSEFQTVVLLLFNNLEQGEKLNYKQIKERTGLEDTELKRTLQSLACGQIPTRVLRKDPQGKDVNDEDDFHVNEALKNDRKRIRINMIQLNETQEEQKSTVDRVMFDRELVLQATAVRILKAKKTIKHAELLQEIVEQIASRFTVDVAEIKKTFEILIDKEYMERVEGQRGMYRYLA